MDWDFNNQPNYSNDPLNFVYSNNTSRFIENPLFTPKYYIPMPYRVFNDDLINKGNVPLVQSRKLYHSMSHPSPIIKTNYIPSYALPPISQYPLYDNTTEVFPKFDSMQAHNSSEKYFLNNTDNNNNYYYYNGNSNGKSNRNGNPKTHYPVNPNGFIEKTLENQNINNNTSKINNNNSNNEIYDVPQTSNSILVEHYQMVANNIPFKNEFIMNEPNRQSINKPTRKTDEAANSRYLAPEKRSGTNHQTPEGLLQKSKIPKYKFDGSNQSIPNEPYDRTMAKNIGLNSKLSSQKTQYISYVSALKESKEKEFLAKPKYTKRDYKLFEKNFGFGKQFLPFESETKEEKLEKKKLRTDYSEYIRMKNFEMLEEQRKSRVKNGYLNMAGYSRNPNAPDTSPDTRITKSELNKPLEGSTLSTNELDVIKNGIKEFERFIKRQHNLSDLQLPKISDGYLTNYNKNIKITAKSMTPNM